MKKLLLLLIFSILCFSFIYPFHTASAWPGCCSHHGGVCGCHCCDGTSLSTTCAPHYPQCSAEIKQNLITPTISTSPKLELDSSKYSAEGSSQNSNYGWLILSGIVGFIVCLFLKRK